MKPRILDLFCKAGGASAGYVRAGFDVVGVDIEPQPNYPFDFIEADALEFLGIDPIFDAIHASPPCQAHSTITPRHRRAGHVDLIPETRRLLRETGLPYVIENVVGAPLLDPVRLCGSSFGLDLRRHRLFETNWPLPPLACNHGWQQPRFKSLDAGQSTPASVVGVHGRINFPGELPVRARAMEIDWMTNAELVKAIPPAFTDYIGTCLLAWLRRTGS